MKISFAATNPCHVYEWARALFAEGHLGHYYSGYPAWKLNCPEGFPVVSSSGRTLLTYGLYRLPERWRPENKKLFRWQDQGFDRSIAQKLQGADFIHGLPGQCTAIFRAAKKQGIVTVLNHASGPVKQQNALVAPEYQRAGIAFVTDGVSDQDYFALEEEAYALADYHCVASSVVKEQLMAEGLSADKIWVIPYGVDASLFPKSLKKRSGGFRICFAGVHSVRKGIFYLMKTLEQLGRQDWQLNCYGPASQETESDFLNYTGATAIERHGSLSRADLGKAFHQHDVLVLPSAEEAFGLVVVQALQAGTPCIVSDRVGAKDMIQHRVNGSIFPFGDSDALAEELCYWEQNRIRVEDTFSWSDTAERLIIASKACR